MRKLIAGISIMLITSIFNTLYAHEQQRRNQQNYGYQQYNNGYANVLGITPVYSNRSNNRSTQRYTTCRSNTGYAGKIAGGVIGGVIGHEIDHRRSGHSHNGATVAGALVGAVVGHQYDKNQRNCRSGSVSYNRGASKLLGYNVTYRYRGSTHQTFMRDRPGRKIAISQLRNSRRY